MWFHMSMRPSKKLFQLIASHMSVPGHVSKSPPESNFVISGLRAANVASLPVRRKILADVSDVLDCRTEDLNFLFDSFSESISPIANYEVMVPDFRSELLDIAE